MKRTVIFFCCGTQGGKTFRMVADLNMDTQTCFTQQHRNIIWKQMFAKGLPSQRKNTRRILIPEGKYIYSFNLFLERKGTSFMGNLCFIRCRKLCIQKSHNVIGKRHKPLVRKQMGYIGIGGVTSKSQNKQIKSVSPFQGRYLNLPLEIVSEGKATKEHIIPRSVRERIKHK